MARYTGPVCRQCRREGEKLFLKGERCYSGKCAVGRRAYPPGQHGQGRKKASEYGLQLRAKQRARRYYGMSESQFHRYFEIAERKQGVTGENLLRLLESRLDNIVYRLGWASSRPEARQLVVHGHFMVGGRRVNVPSFLTRPGDVVTVGSKSRDKQRIKDIIEANSAHPVPKWLDLNAETLEAKVLNLPEREEIEAPVEEQLIVEFYSK
ncbi:MAG TPA: 30S ribosomal protein S4 [Ruminococcaceae bacterium]|nr:30S ribosomal protein S4 [Oscillospiraceae bacterium]